MASARGILNIQSLLPHPRGTPGGKPQRLTARAKIARARPDRFWPGEALFDLSVCPSVCGARATSQIWEQKRALCSFERRHPKFLHRPKRLRCDSDPAGAATPQIAPPTRAPAGRRLTDARHSRHARSRSHHGHRSATVTPESLQAAGIEAAVRHDTVVSRRRRRHATAASSDFFCVPFGGRANGRVSTPRPTPSPTTAAPAPSMRTAPTAARASRLFAHVRRDVQLGFRRRLRRRRPRLGFRPARADSMWDRTIVSCGGNKSVSDKCVYMTSLLKNCNA